MEEIAGSILHFIGRSIAWFFIDIFFHFVCWGIGWLTLKILTFGKYPTASTKEDTIALAGFVVLIITLVCITLYFHFYA